MIKEKNAQMAQHSDELIGILRLISIVSNRLAQKLELVDKLRATEESAKQKGGNCNVRKN